MTIGAYIEMMGQQTRDKQFYRELKHITRKNQRQEETYFAEKYGGLPTIAKEPIPDEDNIWNVDMEHINEDE